MLFFRIFQTFGHTIRKNFLHADLGTKILMANKLVKKAKRSVFAVVSVGPRANETVIQWEIRISNMRRKVEQHKAA